MDCIFPLAWSWPLAYSRGSQDIQAVLRFSKASDSKNDISTAKHFAIFNTTDKF